MKVGHSRVEATLPPFGGKEGMCHSTEAAAASQSQPAAPAHQRSCLAPHTVAGTGRPGVPAGVARRLNTNVSWSRNMERCSLISQAAIQSLWDR